MIVVRTFSIALVVRPCTVICHSDSATASPVTTSGSLAPDRSTNQTLQFGRLGLFTVIYSERCPGNPHTPFFETNETWPSLSSTVKKFGVPSSLKITDKIHLILGS
jgi:hypothetical protein